MSGFFKKYYLILAVLGLSISFVCLNIISRLTAENLVWDMTQEGRYSLSSYSRRQAKDLTQPLYITVYYSADIAEENPVYGRYAEFVIRFLQQYQKSNPDKIFITVKNPEPYSETQKEAQRAGINAYPSADGRGKLYFGAVFSDTDNRTEVIPEFSIDRDFWLEKDITAVLARFNQQERPILGLISPRHHMIKRSYGTETESFALLQELSAEYNILELAANIGEIPEQVDVLLLVAPQKMPVSLQYALDQYVLRGGRLVILADMFTEEPHSKTSVDTLKNMNKLLSRWGVELSENLTGSQITGEKIFIQNEAGDLRQAAYPLWINLLAENINQQSEITAGLKNIALRSALEIKEIEHDKDMTVVPLLQIKGGMDYAPEQGRLKPRAVIEAEYQDDGRTRWMAVEIEGKFQSLFNRPPSSVTKTKMPYLYYSARPAKIVIIGDSDFIRDDVWLTDNILRDNGQMVLKAVDVLNDKAGMAALYKPQQKINQESLGSRIYDKIYNRYAAEINRLQTETENLSVEQQEFYQAGGRLDARSAAHINRLKEKIKENQMRLQYYDYDIKRSFNTTKQSIIFVNTLIIPLGIILLLCGGYGWFSRRRAQKIKEKYNVR